ncbi:MAG: hypothetical protein UV92_C0027G0007 [Parcubacteria group bacterium GW2011_GWA1_43_27]|nr:MAG: hypothetical protein UV92_C0027G0007 [Parcubacteria group bacterium GW2011_GWA1_43_27]KKT21122.1 MAG: hypothetical protein UW06_C0044G0010 [Parcubacteria group bacterium GW2011_GWE1_43_8]
MQTTSPKVVFNNFDDGTFIAFLKNTYQGEPK